MKQGKNQLGKEHSVKISTDSKHRNRKENKSNSDTHSCNIVKKAGIRVEADTRNEKINYKVREHSVGKVPVILAIGMKEVEERTVSVRRLGENRTETASLDAILADLAQAAQMP